MRLKMTGAAVCAALAIGTTMAAAQTGSGQQQTKSNVPLHGQTQIFFRADQLVGKSAQTPVGQDLGKIQDIAFNPEKGIYGVIKAENDRLVALPWSLVTAVTEKAVVFNTSAQELAGAPSFTEKQWTKFNEPQFTQQIDSHFKGSAMGGSSGQESQGQSSGAAASQSANAQGAGSIPEEPSSQEGSSGSATNPPPGSPSGVR